VIGYWDCIERRLFLTQKLLPLINDGGQLDEYEALLGGWR
jgi:hypothetical protein